MASLPFSVGESRASNRGGAISGRRGGAPPVTGATNRREFPGPGRDPGLRARQGGLNRAGYWRGHTANPAAPHMEGNGAARDRRQTAPDRGETVDRQPRDDGDGDQVD